jgi:hypothetical protein
MAEKYQFIIGLKGFIDFLVPLLTSSRKSANGNLMGILLLCQHCLKVGPLESG